MIIFYHQKIDAGISGINLILNPAIKSVKFLAIKPHLIRARGGQYRILNGKS
ncbi:hypothetical protein SD3246_2753 [Salmonella enterica subsp. enterica serovar Dublin str. SD3246]|uniref:Uncharacterized protein n=1 Tax=Salmonella enterica subsp. enterica serovar Dublin str. SD3246 TaxID=909945 RepID=A0A8X6K1N1_SALDU|nr:hypothetical protein SD3246_2753 [Salmonella enterica subsp. enterica serovar Dublin str. SD3246]